MDNMVELIGLLAGACTTTSFIPQVVQIWRTKSVKDISLGMYSLLAVGLGTWLVYGLIIGSTSLIITNTCTLSLAALIFVMKLKYRKG
jgi:MtN3 and saliva related transmembrane protein